MALNSAVRSAIKSAISSSDVALSRSVVREFHATGTKRMGGGHGHAHDGGYHYEHTKHMYNLHRMKNQQLKMCLSVLSAFSIGVAVPVYAVLFQQKKTASG
ncbi:TonB-dependent heme receptor A [Rhynchospora pubera]|uniref:TonB-dependent heme receptor A n=1 Tax=Rhynchospora pubera TaxID=906938 RepID=A0AAV8H072_9POAL|nr:TonB-dependent heme receptor A [Rhynchospora pubera]KAJ4810877.1 TonB-dependent heme receptor A [Rhynchospora pubera]